MAKVLIRGHRLLLVLLLVTVTGALPVSVSARGEWYPLQVDVWEPPFNKQRQRVVKTYSPLPKASKRWHLCALIPHLKDAFWLAANYGLVDQARKTGVDLTIFEAGGYDRLEVQRKQFDECLQQSRPVDGIILSAIAADGLNEQIALAAKQKIPVIDLINGVDSPDIAARSAVDYYDNGYLVGEYIRDLAAGAAEEDAKVAWFPGPEGAAWVAAGDAGFKAALADSKVSIVVTSKGDTGKSTQGKLIEAALDENEGGAFDYIVGTTVSAEAAEGLLRSRGQEQRTRVLAYYFGPGVNRGIRRGTILAAPADSTVVQARIAVDTLVRILEGEPYFQHVAPQLKLIDQQTIHDWDSTTTLAPRGFRPVFSVKD